LLKIIFTQMMQSSP